MKIKQNHVKILIEEEHFIHGETARLFLLVSSGDVELNGKKNPVTVIDAAHYWSHTDDHGPHLFSVIIDKSTINEPLCRPNYILTLFFTQTIGMFLWFLMCDYTHVYMHNFSTQYSWEREGAAVWDEKGGKRWALTTKSLFPFWSESFSDMKGKGNRMGLASL